MSLLTRCPACTTLYRVVPDQLRISEGWVKCGQCGDIFDASKHLIEASIDPEPPRGAEVGASLTADLSAEQDLENQFSGYAPMDDFEAGASNQSLPASGPGLDPDQDADLNPGPHAPDQYNICTDIDTLSERNSDVALALESQTAEPGPLSDEELDPELELPPCSLQVQREDDTPLDGSAAPVNAFPDTAPVTFLQAGQRQALWRNSLVRAALVLASLVLGLFLAGQWVYVERDRLAAQQPDLKPLLQTFCSVANCEVQPLKRIEALSVDSVGFHQLGQDTYRLSFVVKNASTLPLAMPDVELALTDSQDHPIYRRVFSSKDLGAAHAEIVAGAEWAGVAVLRVTPGASGQLVRGYRLLVFYP